MKKNFTRRRHRSAARPFLIASKKTMLICSCSNIAFRFRSTNVAHGKSAFGHSRDDDQLIIASIILIYFGWHRPAMNKVTLRQVPFADFEALREGVQDAPIDIVQLESGTMTGTVTHLSVGSIGVSVGSFSLGFRACGVQSDHRWTLSHNSGPAVLRRFEIGAGDLFLLAPGQEIYARYSGANRYAALLIAPDELFAYLESQQPGAADAAVWRQCATALTLDPTTAAANIRQGSMLLDLLAKHGPKLSSGEADFYRRSLLHLKTAPLRNAVSYRGAPVRSAVALVRKADRYLADAGARPVHVSELCAVLGVSERALQRAFEDVLGMGPIAFSRRKRLGDVHSALKRAAPGATVKDIALAHGFADQPRFARAFRQAFGELPSRTLGRHLFS
jgi:AraC family ethanolamine operon transcriptional activator